VRRLPALSLGLLLLALAAAPAAGAAEGAKLEAGDRRIRTVAYDADAVVALKTFAGFETMIAFAEGEKIQNVAIGDGSAFQVTPNHGANLLFIKPVERSGRTNMTVVTDERSYLFELSANDPKLARPGEVVYLLRFVYPPPANLPVAAPAPPPPQPAPPERRNAAYSYTGARELLPSTVFDDGRYTYFQWPEGAPAPAVFVIAEDGKESLVNTTFRDGFEVIEEIAPRFRLRSGQTVTTVINEAYRPPAPGPLAPRPHNAKTAREAEREAAREAKEAAKAPRPDAGAPQ
jgi:type IV secretion system protein VirB9